MTRRPDPDIGPDRNTRPTGHTGPRCRSWRIRGFRIVRCSWPRDHVRTSKWHCAETTTGHVWAVKEEERTHA